MTMSDNKMVKSIKNKRRYIDNKNCIRYHVKQLITKEGDNNGNKRSRKEKE